MSLPQMMIPEELKKKSEFLAALKERTDPNKSHVREALSMKIAPPIASIRAKLELAKQYLGEVSVPQQSFEAILSLSCKCTMIDFKGRA